MDNPLILISLVLLIIGTSTLSIFLCKLLSKSQETQAKDSKKSRYLGLLVTSFISFSCLFSMIWFYNLDLASGDVGQVRAAPIIQALESYKTDRGAYPSSLVALAPTYIEKIPQPDWRQEYQYSSYSSDQEKIYHLEFRLGGGADDWYCYDSYSKSWEYHDSVCQYDYDSP